MPRATSTSRKTRAKYNAGRSTVAARTTSFAPTGTVPRTTNRFEPASRKVSTSGSPPAEVVTRESTMRPLSIGRTSMTAGWPADIPGLITTSATLSLNWSADTPPAYAEPR